MASNFVVAVDDYRDGECGDGVLASDLMFAIIAMVK